MKNTKKGFTLVELLVVIAIVAILATVAIIGYTSFMKKADLSNDQSAIAQMNTALQASAIPNGFENPSDAIDALYNVGWNFGKMQPYSNNFKYAYNYTENKMYLIDDKGDVVYPEAADKAKLWGIYDDASNEIIDGITNYIVLGNISSTDHFESAFGNANNYVIDLNDFCIKVDGEYANVKLINGGLISGAFSADSSITEYEAYEGTVAGSNASYKNVAFNDFKVESSESTWWSNVTFENCVFYNSSIRTYGNVKFVNCQFINSADFDSQNIDIYNQGKEFDEYTVIFEHCSFSGGYRAINVSGANPTTTNIIIDGCEFNGIDKDKQMIQVASDNINVEIKNTKFNALGKALSLIEIEKADTTFTCTNNTINSDIPVEQYVTVAGTATAEQDTEVTNMLK